VIDADRPGAPGQFADLRVRAVACLAEGEQPGVAGQVLSAFESQGTSTLLYTAGIAAQWDFAASIGASGIFVDDLSLVP